MRAAHAGRERLFAAGLLDPEPDPLPTCSCPPDCDDLLLAEEPSARELERVPHVEHCGCRCDVG